MNRSQSVIVLGMHRSGTSAMAGMLSELGVFMGRRLFAAQQGVNDKGFYENADVVKLNERILDTLPASWDQPLMLETPQFESSSLDALRDECLELLINDYADQSLWGIKDPRMCLTLPLWGELIRQACQHVLYVFVLRHPGQVAASLHRRDGFSMEKSALVWLNYTLSAWQHGADQDRLVVSYQSLIEDARTVAAKLVDRLQLNADLLSTLQFVDASMQRNSTTKAPETALERLALEVYETLIADSTDESAMQRLSQQYADIQSRVPDAFREHLAAVTRSEVHFRTLFEDAYYSWWWRLARPFKRIEETLRRGSNQHTRKSPGESRSGN